jgi:hypothetical protein
MSVPGFFSRGISVRLPHPRVDDRVILKVHETIIRAFELLRAEPPKGFMLSSALEDDITRQLEWILENRLRHHGEVPGFDSRSFGKITRANELTNYNGTHLAKKPDLVFDLKRDALRDLLHTHDALFVECKPVDKKHPIRSDYCDAGLRRFIDGDYAWTMQEGMMVAYVRDGRTIAKSLVPELAKRARQGDLGRPTSPSPLSRSRPSKTAEALHVTVHERAFAWSGGQGRACPIRMFHSWHACG